MNAKTIIAKADTPDKNGMSFCRETLRNIVKNNPSYYFFDEDEGVLYCIAKEGDKNEEITILASIRKTIGEEIMNLSTKPYSDSIISIQLEMARDIYGKQIKNSLIDEFGLDKYGWDKDSEEIRRHKA